MEHTPNIPTLETRNLAIGYPKSVPPVRLAQDICLQVQAGSLTAVIGANGVGKSTLLRTLCGLQPALAGDILWNGHPLARIGPEKRATLMSVVLTEPPASRNLTVAELVALGRHPHTNWAGRLTATDQEAVNLALERMELQGLSGRACHSLSDGQLQRVCIARALAQDTPLLLLDEPTTHLDLYHKVQILKTLRQIAEDTGKTVVFTTHEVDLALQLCDHLLMMLEGQTLFGQPDALIKQGALEALFPQDTIRFDKDSRSFRVRQ